MGEELGKIERLEPQYFEGRRKLYVVSLIFLSEESPPEYREKFAVYWEEVSRSVERLEAGMGVVAHVYHESIVNAGEEGLKVIERLSPPSHRITAARAKAGAKLEATEDRDLAEESIDWERALFMGFISRRAAEHVSQLYTEATKKRFAYIARIIDETLKPGEAALLFIREGHSVQFAADIEVFSVVPPVLDDIHRWQRARRDFSVEGEEPEAGEAEK